MNTGKNIGEKARLPWMAEGDMLKLSIEECSSILSSSGVNPTELDRIKE